MNEKRPDSESFPLENYTATPERPGAVEATKIFSVALDDTASNPDPWLDGNGVIPKRFKSRNPSIPLPCLELEENWTRSAVQRSPAYDGLFFVKPPKAGSTTAASVTLRIAHQLSVAQNKTTMTKPQLCRNRVQHTVARMMGYKWRNKTNSVLWSVLRDPTARALSQYFHFHVSRKGIEASDESFFDYFGKREDNMRSFQLKYLSLRSYHDGKTDPVRAISSILRDYDFIGIMERMDESVVALQMILGLNAADVMYMRYVAPCRKVIQAAVNPSWGRGILNA